MPQPLAPLCTLALIRADVQGLFRGDLIGSTRAVHEIVECVVALEAGGITAVLRKFRRHITQKLHIRECNRLCRGEYENEGEYHDRATSIVMRHTASPMFSSKIGLSMMSSGLVRQTAKLRGAIERTMTTN